MEKTLNLLHKMEDSCYIIVFVRRLYELHMMSVLPKLFGCTLMRIDVHLRERWVDMQNRTTIVTLVQVRGRMCRILLTSDA